MLANARMYSATPAVKQAWKDVLAWALSEAGLVWSIIDHDPPAPLSVLWAHHDLGCAMMCGLPYSQRAPRPTLVVAPVPSPARCGGRPVYCTDIVVRADSPVSKLEDTFGGVVGYTVRDSMSGYVALRRHLLPYRQARADPLYREAVGNLLNARGVINALDAGRIDVGPLDSYYHDLLRRNDPDFAAKVRVIATTELAPIPPFVATAPIEPQPLDFLRAALLAVSGTPALVAQRDTLLLEGFVVPDPGDYDIFDSILSSSTRYPDPW